MEEAGLKRGPSVGSRDSPSIPRSSAPRAGPAWLCGTPSVYGIAGIPGSDQSDPLDQSDRTDLSDRTDQRNELDGRSGDVPKL